MTGQGPLSEEGLVRLLDRNGQRTAHPEYDAYAADLTPETLRSMWRDMMLTRAFDLEATALQRQGELGLWVPSLGQEAAQIGSGYALRPQDYVFPSYREHGVALTRGVDLPGILGTFRGLEHSSWDPSAHNFHVYTLVIGAHSLHAVGYGVAMDRDGLVGTGDPARDAGVICYFGDGATSQGDVNEALNFAAVYRAPVVFFCQNNQFAISVPTTKQTAVPVAQRASGFGIPGIRVDGNDVIASYAVTAEALERARSGGGPTFVEAFTYRMGAHTTSDDPTRYRSAAEEEYWRQRDPVDRLRTYLRVNGWLDEAQEAAFAAEGAALAEEVRRATRALGRPETASMFEHVYATENPLVTAEKEWYLGFEDSFLPAGGAR